MLRRITVAIGALALFAAGAPNAEAGKLRSKYRDVRTEVVKQHGKHAAGRNIVKDGVRTKHGDRYARRADLHKSIGVLQGLLEPASSTTTSPGLQSGASTPTSSPSSGGCGAIPGYIVQRESGGDPGAVNSTSGAFGCYQLLPSHFSAGGACDDLGRDQAGQDACAGRLWNGGAGSSNWAATR